MKEQTRNIEIQIKRGNGKITWKRIQNNDSKDDQNLEYKMEKMQESVNKNLEEIKYKHRQNGYKQKQLLKLKIL